VEFKSTYKGTIQPRVVMQIEAVNMRRARVPCNEQQTLNFILSRALYHIMLFTARVLFSCHL